MLGCEKFDSLTDKTYDRLVKEMKRRGMDYDFRNWNKFDLAANILAYDAYHEGRSVAIQKMKQKKQEPVKAPASTAKNYIYYDFTCNRLLQLRLTDEQKRLVDHFFDEGILEGKIETADSNGWKDI